MTDQEINEAVARKLGWNGTHQKSSWKNYTWLKPDGSGPHNLPDYCHSIEAAWEIVEHLSRNNWTMVLEQHGLGLPHYTVRFSKIPFSDEMTSHETADTVTMAICLAFLKLEAKA